LQRHRIDVAAQEFWTLDTLKRLDYSANGHGTQGSHLFGAFLVPRRALEQLAFEYKGAGQFGDSSAVAIATPAQACLTAPKR